MLGQSDPKVNYAGNSVYFHQIPPTSLLFVESSQLNSHHVQLFILRPFLRSHLTLRFNLPLFTHIGFINLI
jgi:hypothetical protein